MEVFEIFKRHTKSFFIVKLMTDLPNNIESVRVVVCNRHFLTYLFILRTQALQEAWWDMIIEYFNLDLYVEISQYDNEQRYKILLGKKLSTFINEFDYEKFLMLCHCHVIHCTTEYNYVLSSLSYLTSITYLHLYTFVLYYIDHYTYLFVCL